MTTFQITKAVAAIAVCATASLILSGCRPKSNDPVLPYELETYTVFSWKGTPDDFCFKVMTRAEANKFIHTWFPKWNAKCGGAELRKALVALPKDSYVLWESWPPKGFDYPPDNVVDEIIAFAETKGIHVKVSPALR
jgi:hypothetical protein